MAGTPLKYKLHMWLTLKFEEHTVDDRQARGAQVATSAVLLLVLPGTGKH
jgi:hypothetical protein